MSRNLSLSRGKMKIVLALVCIAVISFSSGILYVHATGSPSTFTISSGVYPGAPTYTIYSEGGVYYVKDAYGAISWSSTNPSIVTQNTINSATNGKVVFIGDVTFATGLTFLYPVNFEIIGDVTFTNTTGALFTIGNNAAYVPPDGSITVLGRVFGPNTATSQLILQDSGSNWNIKLSSVPDAANTFGTIWEINSLSDNWLTGNVLTTNAFAINHVWWITNSAYNDKAQGNQLNVMGACHSSLTPILFEGGTNNRLIGFAHCNSADTTIPDINDTSSGGYDQFIANFLNHPTATENAISHTSQLIYNGLTPQAITNGLVAYYPLAEGSGTTTSDISGYANNGTISGATWSSGQFGDKNALAFYVGNSAYVACGSNPILFPKNAITVSAWIYLATATGSQTIVGATPASGNGGYELALNYNTAYFGIQLTGGTWVLSGYSAGIPLTTWTYVTGVYDGVNLYIYVNGVLANSNAQTGAMAQPSGETLAIGRLGALATDYLYNGVISEVRIYNWALSTNQIYDNMESQFGE